MRIAVVRLGALGDVVGAEIVVRALRGAHPDAELVFVTDPPYQALVAATFGVDRVQGLTAPAARLDLAVDLSNKLRSRLFCARHAARVVAAEKRSVPRAALALVAPGPLVEPVASTYARALARIGVPLVDPAPRLPTGRAGRIPRDRGDRGVGDTPPSARFARRISAIGLGFGARWATKRWPVARASRLAALLRRRFAGELVEVAGPDDPPIPGLDRSTRGLDVLGLFRAIAELELFVGVDSGPAHLALAAGVPTLVLFGPTSACRHGPRVAHGRALALELSCSPCSSHGELPCRLGHRACLEELSEVVVLQAIEGLLASAPPPG